MALSDPPAKTERAHSITYYGAPMAGIKLILGIKLIPLKQLIGVNLIPPAIYAPTTLDAVHLLRGHLDVRWRGHGGGRSGLVVSLDL